MSGWGVRATGRRCGNKHMPLCQCAPSRCRLRCQAATLAPGTPLPRAPQLHPARDCGAVHAQPAAGGGARDRPAASGVHEHPQARHRKRPAGAVVQVRCAVLCCAVPHCAALRCAALRCALCQRRELRPAPCARHPRGQDSGAVPWHAAATAPPVTPHTHTPPTHPTLPPTALAGTLRTCRSSWPSPLPWPSPPSCLCWR